MQSNRPQGNQHRANKEERLSALFDTCYPRLARYAYARIGNAAEAEDIASDVFVRAFEALDSYRERGAPMEAWLFRIAHNLVVDYFRQSDRVERVIGEDLDVGAATTQNAVLNGAFSCATSGLPCRTSHQNRRRSSR